MTDRRRFGARELVLFLLIVAGAAAMRIEYVQLCQTHDPSNCQYAVQEDWNAERESLVGNLRAGQGFVTQAPLAGAEEPTAHRAIGYQYPC